MKLFLRYYVELPFPLTKVDRTITALPGELLDAAAREASLCGLLVLGPSAANEVSLAAADICVALAAPDADNTLIRRPLQWFAGRGELADPVLQGDLELAELGPSRTQLAITAQFRPMADAAESAGRTVARRVGESTLKAFLDRLATYVQAMLGGLPRTVVNRRFEMLARLAT